MRLFLKGLKFCFGRNTLLTLSLVGYIWFIENWLVKPVESFPVPLKVGTIVDDRRLFDSNLPARKLRKSWLNILDKFSYFLIEYQLRPDYNRPSPRLLKWCESQNCFAPRINYGDARKNQFNTFTVDDWFTNNFLITRDVTIETQALNFFWQLLPVGSTVIISEPFSSFSRPQVFQKFSEWIFQLRSDHPGLKFEMGLQVHLQ